MLRRLLVSVCLLASTVASAHPGPQVELAALNRKLAENPRDADLLLQRAAIYRDERQLEGALADLARAAEIAPDRRDVLLERGLTLAAMGRSGAAEADLTRFLDTGAPSVAALRARAALREASKRWALARADYDAALRHARDVELYLGRGRADEALGAADRAAAGYEEALKATQGAVVLRLALIRVETARGRYDRAVSLIDEAMATSPLKAAWLLRRADVHAAGGRPKLAEDDRLAALRELDGQLAKRPSDLARLTRARAIVALGRRALGRRSEATLELERIVARSPRNAEARELLGQLKARTPPR